MSFIEEFKKLTGQILGKPFEEVSTIAELYSLLSLDGVISDEALRQIVTKRQNPSEKTQKKILSHLRRLTQGAMNSSKPRGFRTKKQLHPFLDSSMRRVVFEEKTKDLPALLIFDALGNVTTLVVCWDDPDDETVLDEETVHGICAAVNGLKKSLLLDVAHVQVITHQEVNQELMRIAKQSSIQIQSINDFYLRVFDLHSADEWFELHLERLRVDTPSRRLPVPCAVRTLGKSELKEKHADVIPLLIGKIQVAGPHTEIVMSSFGTGKSACAHLVGALLLREARVNQRSFPLPVVVPGGGIVSISRINETLGEAIYEIYKARLPSSVIEDLIERGLLIVIVDALDEAPANSSPSTLASCLEALPWVSHKSSSYILTIRSEFFTTLEEEKFTLSKFAGSVIQLLPLNVPSAVTWLKNEVGPAKIQSFYWLTEDPRFADILGRPLFLNFFCALKDEDLRVNESLDDHQRLCTMIYRFFNAYFEMWAARESQRMIPSRLPIEEHTAFRLTFCQTLAAFLEMRESQSMQFEELSAAITQIYEDHPRSPLSYSDVRKHLFFLTSDAQLSLMLVRDPSLDHFQFAHASFETFFFGRLLADEIESGKFSFLDHIFVKSAKLPVLCYFLVGGLCDRKPESPVEEVKRAIDSIRRRNHSRVLAMNLLVLLSNLLADQPEFFLDASGLNLALAELNPLGCCRDKKAFVVDGRTANLEFAVLSNDNPVHVKGGN